MQVPSEGTFSVEFPLEIYARVIQKHRKKELSSRAQGEVPSEGTLSVEFPLEIYARVILPKHKVSTNSGKGFTHMEGTELKPGKKGFEI